MAEDGFYRVAKGVPFATIKKRSFANMASLADSGYFTHLMYPYGMSGASLLVCILLIVVVLPGAVTLLVPKRWLPVWLGLLALFILWIWSAPFDGPGAVFAYLGVMIISVLNGVIILARVIKIAFDRDREQ